MPTVTQPAPEAQQVVTSKAEALANELIPLAAQLVGCVHDHGPDARDLILSRVGADQWHAFAVVLAAMVDPDRSVAEALAWTQQPPRSLEGTDYDVAPEPWVNARKPCPDCGRPFRSAHLARHRRQMHGDNSQAA